MLNGSCLARSLRTEAVIATVVVEMIYEPPSIYYKSGRGSETSPAKKVKIRLLQNQHLPQERPIVCLELIEIDTT